MVPHALQPATKTFSAVLDDLTVADIASNKDDAPIEEGIVAPMRRTQCSSEVGWKRFKKQRRHKGPLETG